MPNGLLCRGEGKVREIDLGVHEKLYSLLGLWLQDGQQNTWLHAPKQTVEIFMVSLGKRLDGAYEPSGVDDLGTFPLGTGC